MPSLAIQVPETRLTFDREMGASVAHFVGPRHRHADGSTLYEVLLKTTGITLFLLHSTSLEHATLCFQCLLTL